MRVRTSLFAPPRFSMQSVPVRVAGPFFIGWLFNIFLLGLLFVQCYLYGKTYRSDPLWMKIYVSVLLLANILNTIFLSIWLYNTLIINFGNIDAIFNADWLFATGAAMTGLIVSYVQLFFTWRVKVLTGSYLLALIVAIPAITGLVAAMTAAGFTRKYPHIYEVANYKGWMVLWLVAETLSDLLITAVLVTYLIHKDMQALTTEQYRNKQGFKASDKIIDRIIRLTVQSGLVTAVIATIDVSLYLAFDESAIRLVFNIPLNKIYSVMLMSSLNSRQGWQYGNTPHSQSNFSSRERSGSHSANGYSVNHRAPIILEAHEMSNRLDNFDSREQSHPFDVKTKDSVQC